LGGVHKAEGYKWRILLICKRYICADEGKIIFTKHKIFYVIGFYKPLNDGSGRLYLQESIVAYGDNLRQLIKSLRRYQRWAYKNWDNYFNELPPPKKT